MQNDQGHQTMWREQFEEKVGCTSHYCKIFLFVQKNSQEYTRQLYKEVIFCVKSTTKDDLTTQKCLSNFILYKTQRNLCQVGSYYITDENEFSHIRDVEAFVLTVGVIAGDGFGA